MHPSTRRVFVLRAIAGSSALAVGISPAGAQETEQVSESDPYARSMGFRLDTSKVDQARYPRHDASQTCAKCQLYDGKPNEPMGPCSFYGGRLVSVNGWCRNFKVRKT